MMRDAEATSRIMAAVRSRDTKPELALRSALWRRGLRYRLQAKLPGKPDIVFPGRRVAVFVDGDFWHGNAWRVRGLASFEAQFTNINNGEFWQQKILSNMRRDSHVNDVLSNSGWTVFRVFESSLMGDVEGIAAEIEMLVRPAKDWPDSGFAQAKER
jgi:DNA mismatch endonuclease, patch repair protein